VSVLLTVCIIALFTLYENRIFSAQFYVVVCGLSGCTIISHIISYTAQFSKRKIYGTQNVF